MARTPSKLNEAKSAVVEKNILLENPEGLPDESNIVIAKHVPVMKKVVFLNGRDPGVALHFHYASATYPLQQFTLYHGFEHELAEEIIDHLESRKEPQYGYRRDPQGHPECFVKSWKYIFQCKPVKKAA